MDLFARAVDWVVARKATEVTPPTVTESRKLHRTTSWEDLPGDIFAVLLHHIDSNAVLKNLRSTCVAWRHHIDTQLQHLSIRINKQTLNRLNSKIFSNVRSLTVYSDYDAVSHTSSTLRDICACPHLSQLLLRNCKGKLLHGLSHLQQLTVLRELHLDGDIFQKLRKEGVRLHSLRVLCIYDCSIFVPEDYRHIGHFSSVNRLLLTNVTSKWKEESAFLKDLTNLSDLVVMQHTANPDYDSFSCLEGVANLQSLVLHEPGITAAALHSLPALMSLQHLTLDGCMELSSRCFQILAMKYPLLASLRIVCQEEAWIAKNIGNVNVLQNLIELDLVSSQEVEIASPKKSAQTRDIRISKIRYPDWTFQRIVKSMDYEVIEQFLTEATQAGVPVSGEYFTPSLMSEIAACKRFDILKLLVAHGADTDYGNPDFAGEIVDTGDRYDCSTALHFAVHKGDVESIRELLNLGARVDAHCSEDSRTSLHLAASNGNVEVVGMLLSACADVNALDYSNRTPLHMAVTWKAYDVVKELLKHGADAEIVDLDLLAPICYAARMGDLSLTHFLLQCGMDVNEGLVLNFSTPLHVAVKAGKWKMAQFLIENGADPCARDIDGLMPLLVAARHGHRPLVESLLESLNYTKDELNERDTTGSTLLHYAAANGWTAVVERLIQLGVDVNRTDLKGFTALYYADQQRHSKIVHRLACEGGLARWLTQPKLHRCPRISDPCRNRW